MSKPGYRIYCLFASLENDIGPWLLVAEDEYAWEGDPQGCEEAFDKARKEAQRNGWVVREVTLLSDIDQVYRAFEVPEVPASVETA